MGKSKKVFLALNVILLSIFLFACGNNNTLLILNWGEYINDDLVKEFEKKYKVEVKVSIADSNELFYSRVKSGTTVYDIVVPSDYMVQKMVSKDLLQKIDFNKLDNLDLNNLPFTKSAIGILEDMSKDGKGINYFDYAIPYFWGTFGLMYNKNKTGLEEAIKDKEWKAYFDSNNLPLGTKKGMYNVSRFSYAAAMFNTEDRNPNLFNDDKLKEASDLLLNANFIEWGTDTLKKGISAGNLDLAFVYTGDFLDMLYLKLEDTDILDIDFDIHIPEDTIAFMDNLVIPKKSRHVDLAHKFIDFMIDPDNAYRNASIVGYATPIQKSYDMITTYVSDINNIDDRWLSSWRDANKKYYPVIEGEKKYKGTILQNFDQAILDRINLMINNVKAK